MKKLLLLPIFEFIAIACTTDNEDFENETAHTSYKVMQITGSTNSSYTLSCFSGLGAHPYIDTSVGLNNATITFISETPSGVSGSFRVRAELEQLGDCEDLTSGTGNVKSFSTGIIYSNIGSNPPQISGIRRADTFACYRWRMVFECVNRSGAVTCVSVTPWYDAPLF